MSVVCEAATLILDDIAERRLALHDKQGGVTYPAYSNEPPLTQEVVAFLNAIRSGTSDTQHIEAGVKHRSRHCGRRRVGFARRTIRPDLTTRQQAYNGAA